jgi:hypothetical protein
MNMGRPTREEAEAKRSAGREEAGRNSRVPLGVARAKLSVPSRPGYVRRWINDEEGRLMNAEAGGYQFAQDASLQIGAPDVDNVNRDLGARISRVVDKSSGKKAYLMEIKEEHYREDQQAKAEKVAEKDRLIKTGKLDDDTSRYHKDPVTGAPLIEVQTRTA